MTNFIHWVGEKKVAVRSLLLTGCNVHRMKELSASMMRLEHVKNITWTGSQYLSSELVEAVLRVCPNIAHLELERCIAFSPAAIAVHVPKLTSIHLVGPQ